MNLRYHVNRADHQSEKGRAARSEDRRSGILIKSLLGTVCLYFVQLISVSLSFLVVNYNNIFTAILCGEAGNEMSEHCTQMHISIIIN